jgi:hypothetical protein
MKKLIAISVTLVLIAGVVFAETSISGAGETRLMLFDYTMDVDNAGPENDARTQGTVGAAWIQLSGTNADGTLGGTFRLRGTDIFPDGSGEFRWHKVNVWWKPIPQMRIFLGQDADGQFETGQLTSWSFHQGSEGFLTVHNWDYWRGIFPGNWDAFGVALSFYLVQGLDLNLVIPVGATGWPRWTSGTVATEKRMYEVYPGSLQLTAGYSIPDVGKIAFAFIGSGQDYSEPGEYKNDPDKALTNYGTIHLSFFSNSLVEGLAFQVGFATDLLKDADDPAPLNIGAAVHFASGDFGVKFRVGANLDLDEAARTFITANVMPTYNTAAGKICLDIGMVMLQANKDADNETGFWINPYLKKGLNGGYFQVGLIVYSNIKDPANPNDEKGIGVTADAKTNLRLPLLLGFNF